MSTPSIIPREQVAQHLSVSPALLTRYEELGLISVVRANETEGYEPAELHRVWTVLTLHRDAGINLAGIEAILHLRDQFDRLHAQMLALTQSIAAALAEPEQPGSNGP